MSSEITRVTIWNEFVHEKEHKLVGDLYPDGIHGAIAEGLKALGGNLEIRTATLEESEHGLTDEVLAQTDVLFWWGHCAHDKVADAIVRKVQTRVLAGMGLVVLHSGHMSKIFRALMGTSGCLKWREAGERERLWVTAPGHPIVAGLGECIELEHTEMYGEPFGIPAPDEQIFISWFEGGEVFRSGCVWNRGNGRIFYFRPGHETYPIYKNAEVLRVLHNAVGYVKPQTFWTDPRGCPNVPADQAPEKIEVHGGSVH
ncbi:MAG: ThuA domain-containing protein [Opitutales bacterium]